MRFHNGVYQPRNAGKYRGKRLPVYRSSWELSAMRMFDAHPNVLAWASECHRIPYINPVTGRRTHYVPDFFVVYMDQNGRQHAEMVEIKPSSQILGRTANDYDRAQAVINEEKWKSAQAFCKNHNLRFRILTEQEMFRNTRLNKRKR